MSIVSKTRQISPTLSNLIAEANFTIESAKETIKEKILKAYRYAIEKDGFTPVDAAQLLREKLTFSKSYIREVLPLEAREQKFSNKPKPEAEAPPAAPIDGLNTSSASAPMTTEIEIPPEEPSELEKFRRARGKVVQPPSSTEQEEQEQEEVTYDNPQLIISQYEKQVLELTKVNLDLERKYEELDEKYTNLLPNYTVEELISGRDQEIPIIIHVDPFKRTAWAELDKKKLSGSSSRR